jgi:periplasmic protein TonB
MNAIAARWQKEEVRLWTGSALAALLVHLAVAALFFLRLQWPAPPAPLAGSPVALNVELASLPSSTARTASSSPGAPLPSPRESTAKQAALAAANRPQPVAEVQPIALQAAPPLSQATVISAAGTTGPTPELSPLTAPQPTVSSQPHGRLGVPQSPAQRWLAQVKAQLQFYKQYPRSALNKKQQDTVTLKFSVSRSGRVTYVRIDSAQHYRALEQEVREMLREAGPLPAPPAQVSVNKIVWNIPVKFQLVSTSSPARCTAPANPGPVPTGAKATLQQLSVYREHLKGYLAASGRQLDCLARAPGATSQADRSSLVRQLHAMVDAFNTQARVFEAKAQATALAQARQAQQAHQQQLQAAAAQVYSGCTSPAAPRAPAVLSADTAQSYRRDLVGYQDAVRAYIACIRKAQRVAIAPERALASDQRAQLDQTGAQLGDTAIQSFNQLVAGFNGKVPHLRQQALAAEEQQRHLAEALVRATAIFPDSSWSVPAPLPADECVRITRSGQTYQAQLCNPTYTTTVSDLSQELKNNVSRPIVNNQQVFPQVAVEVKADALSGLPAEAFQQEAIAAEHGFPSGGKNTSTPILGIAVTTQAGFAGQVSTGPTQQTLSYSVSELQVSGRRLSMTISSKSDQDGGKDDVSSVHFDLVLSPDNQTLRGYCWTGQKRSECTLTRHASASGPRDSRH